MPKDGLPSQSSYRTADQGGGVSLENGTFIIYTQHTGHHSPISTALEHAANEVAGEIAFITPREEQNIRSFPIDYSSTSIPPFIVNASAATLHCIAMSSTASKAEHLLALLQRPWCVLELCCATSTLALNALLHFADTARWTCAPCRTFEASYLLFSHELETRSASEQKRRSLQQRFQLIDAITTGFFRQTLASHCSQWLRMVLVCAIYRSMSVRELLRSSEVRDALRAQFRFIIHNYYNQQMQ